MIIAMLVFTSCTIVKNDGSDSKQREIGDLGVRASTFDPIQYAEEIWEPVVLPRIDSLAVNFHELLDGLSSNENATSERYGYRLLEEGNHYNFAVKGTVKFLSIDTSSANGTTTLDFAPYDGQADCIMMIGPVFRSLAIRDIQNSISLNDFTNQVEFARIARELNNKVRDLVLEGIDFSQCIGSEADLIGVFTYDGPGSTIEIMPVRLSIK
ncbi:MAG: DUF2291 domain-containing protein [Treponema sp.]|nr:DUF2291 domain-containing protein [Treponema sp.]